MEADLAVAYCPQLGSQAFATSGENENHPKYIQELNGNE
jgi:hypothetical protein